MSTNRVDEALRSLRAQPQAQPLRTLLERNIGLSPEAYMEESIGMIAPADAAALSVIRAIFCGGPGE